jgi:very-short-patch-repair endonuclease
MTRYARVESAQATPSDVDGLELVLFKQSQVVSRRQALRFLSEPAVRHRLESGSWRVAERGVYVTHTGPVTHEQRLMIASLAAGAGRPALLGGLSALSMMGFRGWRSDGVQILLPWRCRDLNPPPWIEVHRSRRLSSDEVKSIARPPHTLEVRSLIDAAQWARTDDEAAEIVAAGYQQRLVIGDEIAQALQRRPVVRRRRLILETATDAAGGSHSLPEVEFLRGCRRNRLPLPTRQAVRKDAAGRNRYLDAYFEEYGVHVEIDGGQHIDIRQWWSDMRRQNELWVTGDRVLRFPAFVVRRRPAEWVPQVRAALIAGGWSPADRHSPPP